MVRHLPVRRLLLLSCLFVAALLLPASYTPSGGAVMNDACANGGCCPEIGSFCGTERGAYLPNSGEMCPVASSPKSFESSRP